MGNKGSNFERDMCRFLSNYITDGERDDVLWRNRTRRRVDSDDAEGVRHQLGDVKAEHPLAIPFIERISIELKSGYAKNKKGKRYRVTNWDVLDMIDGGACKFLLREFWNQCSTDASLTNRVPLLIVKRDYKKPFVAIDKPLNSFFAINGDYITLRHGNVRLFLYDANMFFKTLTVEKLLDAADKYIEMVYRKRRRKIC